MVLTPDGFEAVTEVAAGRNHVQRVPFSLAEWLADCALRWS